LVFWFESAYVLEALGLDSGRVHFVVLTIFFYSIMADAQYAFIFYLCIICIEKACSSVVVVCASGAKVHVFEPGNGILQFSTFIFFNCGAHELLQSNFSLLIYDTEWRKKRNERR